jgi:hypothetical protein
MRTCILFIEIVYNKGAHKIIIIYAKKLVFWNLKAKESTHSIGTPKRHINTMPAKFWYLNEENRLISSISFGDFKKKRSKILP